MTTKIKTNNGTSLCMANKDAEILIFVLKIIIRDSKNDVNSGT